MCAFTNGLIRCAENMESALSRIETIDDLDRYFDDKLATVHATYQYQDWQRGALHGLFAGNDVFVVASTSAGKSLVIEMLPRIIPGKMVLVILPLNSLQVTMTAAFREKGLKVLCAVEPDDEGSRMNVDVNAALRGSFSGYDVVMASAELVVTKKWLTSLGKASISTIFVDEAHCSYHWYVLSFSYDNNRSLRPCCFRGLPSDNADSWPSSGAFRPAYGELHQLRLHIPGVPVCALTATLPAKVCLIRLQ